MAGERIKLTAAHRERLGSPESRRLRKRGLVPGVLYGRDAPISICVEERELRRALTTSGGLHAILDVQIDGTGKSHASILKDYQVDKVRGHVTHIDLQEVRLDQPIHAAVTISLIGGEDAPGVREGGVLSQPLRELNVEALPLEVPEHIDVDVSQMEMGGTLRVADIAARDGVTLLDDPETVVATVTAPTREVAPEEALEGAEAEALTPETEGGTPEGGAEAPAEPEASAAGEQGTVEG
jgi:large subunit ribosomal protein L25